MPNEGVYVKAHSVTERGHTLHQHLEEWWEIKDRARGITRGEAFSLGDALTR